MLSRVTVKGYRNVLASAAEFKRVNVLVGPNNAGKSNFLRALRFVSDFAGGGSRPAGLANTVTDHGAENLRTWGSSATSPVEFRWHGRLEGGDEIQHRLEFAFGGEGSFPQGFHVVHEQFIVRDEMGQSTPKAEASWFPLTGQLDCHVQGKKLPASPDAAQLNTMESLLIQRSAMLERDGLRDVATKVLGPPAKQWLAELQRLRVYRCAHFDPDTVAAPAQSEPETRFLAVDGRNLANVLRHIEQAGGEGLGNIQSRMTELIPDLQRLWVYDGAGNQRWVRLALSTTGQPDGPARTVQLGRMSDGTVQALVLATLLFSPEPARVLCLDEPELNLHPAWVRRMGLWMDEGHPASQLFLSTHSPELLDALTDGFVRGDVAVFVFGKGGSSSPRQMRRLALSEVQGTFDQGWQLGDLYRVGDVSLGGWPW